MAPKVWTKSIPNCSPPMKNSAFPSKSKKCSPVSLSMRSLTASQSPPPLRKHWQKQALSFALFQKPCKITPTSCASISVLSFRTPTIILPRSTPLFLAMDPFAISPKACAAQWNYRRISASTPPTPGSLSARSSSLKKVLMCRIWKAVRRPCATKINSTQP